MRQLFGRARRQFAPHLAGWLFADLLLLLFLVALVSVPPSAATPAAEPTTTPMPSPSSTPGPPKLPVLDLESVNFKVSGLNADGLLREDPSSVDALVEKFRDQLTAKGAQSRRAGLVLTFGAAPTYDYRSGIGYKIADELIKLIKSRLPLFAGIASRSLWTTGTVGDVELEVFFFDE
jgi:hypothetical protein